MSSDDRSVAKIVSFDQSIFLVGSASLVRTIRHRLFLWAMKDLYESAIVDDILWCLAWPRLLPENR